jgi:hypothetical protein
VEWSRWEGRIIFILKYMSFKIRIRKEEGKVSLASQKRETTHK